MKVKIYKVDFILIRDYWLGDKFGIWIESCLVVLVSFEGMNVDVDVDKGG